MPYARRRFFRRRYTPFRRFRTYRRRSYTGRYRSRSGFRRRYLGSRRGVMRRRSRSAVPYSRRIDRIPWSPIAPMVLTKFKMEDVWNFQVTAPGGASAGINLYGNNAYDPVVGSSTSACSGYSQLMQIYKYCTCYGTKVRAIFNLYLGHQCFGYILMEDHNFRHSTGITRDFLRENPRDCRSAYLFNGTYNSSPKTITLFRTTKSLEQKTELENPAYSSTSSGGPTIYTYAQVGIVPSGSGVNPGGCSVFVNIRITYYCKLFDRVNLDA